MTASSVSPGVVDSAYLAYTAHRLGLRMLAVHVDTGWNSEIAVRNIERLCDKLQLQLHTIVMDWPTMKELQRAYQFSGLANLDVPQDHLLVAAVYRFAQGILASAMYSTVPTSPPRARARLFPDN